MATGQKGRELIDEAALPIQALLTPVSSKLMYMACAPRAAYAHPRPRAMPRTQRTRVVFCGCLDCAEPDEGAARPLAQASEAAARQEPPPKCLLIYGHGLLVRPDTLTDAQLAGLYTSLEAAACPHLDRAVADGGIGMLAARRTAGEMLIEYQFDRAS